jgi:hypothetical protein
MRVEVKAATKKKQESSLGLLLLIGSLFAFVYLVASPGVAAYFPHSVERALTNYRGEIDKIADGAMTSIRDTLAMVGLR